MLNTTVLFWAVAAFCTLGIPAGLAGLCKLAGVDPWYGPAGYWAVSLAIGLVGGLLVGRSDFLEGTGTLFALWPALILEFLING